MAGISCPAVGLVCDIAVLQLLILRGGCSCKGGSGCHLICAVVSKGYGKDALRQGYSALAAVRRYNHYIPRGEKQYLPRRRGAVNGSRSRTGGDKGPVVGPSAPQNPPKCMALARAICLPSPVSEPTRRDHHNSRFMKTRHRLLTHVIASNDTA